MWELLNCWSVYKASNPNLLLVEGMMKSRKNLLRLLVDTRQIASDTNRDEMQIQMSAKTKSGRRGHERKRASKIQ